MLWIALSLSGCPILCAQDFNDLGQVTGMVYGVDDSQKSPLLGAYVQWKNSSRGVVTDEEGRFLIDRLLTDSVLLVSYVGYKSVEVIASSVSEIHVVLEPTALLDDVVVKGDRSSIVIDHLNPIKSELVDEAELLKAACCSLSESFETNPSVDVSFTDAVTGTRQIQMLGLAGPYIQINRENIPDIRGMSSIYGLTYIPGVWIEGLQLNKGTGSVINGFESMAGQINVELRKPDNSDKLYVNAYANQGGRLELNLNTAIPLNTKWSTAILLHHMANNHRNDRNGDGFMDMPVGTHYIGLNRWSYTNGKGFTSQFGLKGTYISTVGGQMDYQKDDHRGGNTYWGMEDETRRVEGWVKVGQVFPAMPWRSYGVQLNAVHHSQQSYLGRRIYDGEQNSFYGNFIYHTIIHNAKHPIKLGASFQYDYFDESLTGIGDDLVFEREESVLGSFLEYENTSLKDITVLTGLRADYHNAYGAFLTPRVHLKYSLSDLSTIRLTAGRGQRTASVIAEQIGALASSRVIRVIGEGNASDKPYGLDAEVSWNMGASWVRDFSLGSRIGTCSVEYYRTQFVNQIVADYDTHPQELSFYNLEGDSYANSVQVQLDYELMAATDLRIGYRWHDVQSTYGERRLAKPLISEHRAFLNLAYVTANEWSFDYTLNWMGRKRISDTDSNPEGLRLDDYSPSYFTMNLHVNKKWDFAMELYFGVENLMDLRQKNPILASENPFGDFFDSAMVWGPVFGRNFYMGIRYRIN